MQHDTVLSEKELFWSFDPTRKSWILTFWPLGLGGRGVWRQNIFDHVAAFLIPLYLICNMTMFWGSGILTFWPQTQGQGGGGGVGWGWQGSAGIYLLPCCCIHDSLEFDMQHDHVLKKLYFDLLTPTLSPPRWWDTGLRSKSTFDMFHLYCTSVCMWNFSKKYWQLSYCDI